MVKFSTLVWKVPFDVQLTHVSAGSSSDSDAVLEIGTGVDRDAYLAATTIGDSNKPAEFDRDDFVGGEFPHIADGTIIAIILDHDGSSGTAAVDFTIVLTFIEG